MVSMIFCHYSLKVQWLLLCTTLHLSFNNCIFPHSVLVFHRVLTIYLNIINQFIFIMEIHYVLCETGTEVLQKLDLF